MVETGLLPDVVANIVVGLVFLGIGVRFRRLPVSIGARRAAHAFSWFWVLYGVNVLLSALRVGRVAFGADGANGFLWVFSFETGFAVFSLWGMMVYLRYLRHGTYGHDGLHVGLLSALAVSYLAIMVYHRPEAVLVESWRTNLAFERPLGAVARWWMAGSFYGLVLVLAGLFAATGLRSGDPVARRRALAVGLLLVWLAVADALVIGPTEPLPYGMVWTFLKAPAALGVLFTYLPHWNGRRVQRIKRR